jgi:hypothetical protein
VGEQDLVALLPPGTDEPGTPLPLSALVDWPLVVTPPGTSSRRILDEALARSGVTLRIAVETAQRDAIVPLVLGGAGASVLPAAVARAAALLGAVAVGTRPRLRRAVCLLHRSTPLSPAAAAFTAALTGRLWAGLEPGRPAETGRTPFGRLFTNRGRVLAYGQAHCFGDTSGTHLNGPVLDSVPTPSGLGYYMVASVGGIFTFGDARFAGSMGGKTLNAPVVAEDGGIFDFSDQPFADSLGGQTIPAPIVSVAALG